MGMKNIAKQKRKPVNKCRVAFILFCCVVPVIHWLVFYAGVNISSFSMAFTNDEGEFTLTHFARLWNDIMNPESSIRIGLKNTLLTFCVSLAAFPFRVLVAYFIYKKVPGYSIYRVLFFFPSIIFSIATSLVTIRLLGVNGIVADAVQSIFNMESQPLLLEDSRYANITILLHMLWFGFAGDLIIWGGTFARIPVEVLESGAIDGVNWWQEFTKIIVPIVWPTVGLKLVLSVCSVFEASGSVFLLTGGAYGTMTLSCWIYKETLYAAGSGSHMGAFHYLATVGLCMTILAVGLSLFVRRNVNKIFDEVEF